MSKAAVKKTAVFYQLKSIYQCSISNETSLIFLVPKENLEQITNKKHK
jgi:hypothetical protein